MYCSPAGQTCLEKVSKEAVDCRTSCEGLYLDVFRADDTKLTTDVMKIGNMIHGLEKTGNFSNQPQVKFRYICHIFSARQAQDHRCSF